MLGPVLFNISSNTDGGIECPLSEFVGGTKLSGAVHWLEGRDAVPRDAGNLEDLWLFRPGKGRLRGDLPVAFQYIKMESFYWCL